MGETVMRYEYSIYASKVDAAPPAEIFKWGCEKFAQMFWTNPDDQIWENFCIRVWHSYGFWYERISEYIRVKKMTRTNIRRYSYEIFWHERISKYIRIKILTQIIFGLKYLNIQIYSSLSGLDWPELCFYNLNSIFDHFNQ